MSKYQEYEGKNIEKAVKKASKKLKIPEKEIKYEIVTYGKTGIFGFGKSKKAKIKIDLEINKKKSSAHDIISEKQKEIKASIRNLIDETFKLKSDPKPEPKPEEKTDPKEEINNDIIKTGKEALTKILDSITTGYEITVSNEKKDNVKFHVTGGDTAILIGKHGQTLEAIQTIVEKIINRDNQKRIRVNLDVEGYLAKREKNLKKHAERLAEKCKRIGKPVTLGQMNSHDRRIVHITLKNDRNVKTQSMGNGFMRKLVIFPKRTNNHKKNKSKLSQ